jgi:hypothetical protein
MNSGPAAARLVYLSASTARASELRDHAETLQELGMEVTSRWPWRLGELERAQTAARDLADLARADTLVAFTQGLERSHQGRGGRHVELGVALGRQMDILLVGAREHVFHHHDSVRTFDDWPSALRALRQGAR